MSNNDSGFGYEGNSTNTTQKILILSGSALGSILILVALAFLCNWFHRRRRHQNTTTVAGTLYLCEHWDGLNPSTMANLPTFRYEGRQGNDDGIECLQCSVCLSTVQEGELLRKLPTCKHMFHQECIDMWFYSHTTCPLCRAIITEDVGEVKVTVETVTTIINMREVY